MSKSDQLEDLKKEIITTCQSWSVKHMMEKMDELVDIVEQRGRDEALDKTIYRLYALRANIPLTGGMPARKQVKELIDDLEAMKNQSK